MHIKCFACDALARVAYFCAAHSRYMVDVELLPFGLHITPKKLRRQLQERIDTVNSDEYDAIILTYGLCGKATAGLVARTLPIVIPRAHDCITLFLGSRERYQREFEAQPGTYWYTKDYIERGSNSGVSLSIGVDMSGDRQAQYEEFVEKYGKDNADYLMEAMGTWQQHYQRAAFIDMKIGDSAAVETQANEEAVRRGWTFDRLNGDLRLMQRLFDGDWQDDMLMLQPGETLAMTADERIVCGMPPTCSDAERSHSMKETHLVDNQPHSA